MAHGFRQFDEQGNIICDVTDRLSRYLGVIEMNDFSDRGSVDVGQGTPWFYLSWDEFNVQYCFPFVRTDGTRIYYGYEGPYTTVPDAPTEPLPAKLYYGAY